MLYPLLSKNPTKGSGLANRYDTSSDLPVGIAFSVNHIKAIMSDLITHISDGSFEDEVINSSTPVIVDYWAEWCGPCKMIAPLLENIAANYEGRLKVAKLIIDDNPLTPPKYGIRGIPTLMIFKNGVVEATKVGAVSESQLTAFIDETL